MLEYDGTDVSKGVHVNQTDGAWVYYLPLPVLSWCKY